MINVLKKVNLRFAVPVVLCYLVVGFFVCAAVMNPELALTSALACLIVVALTMAVVVGINR